MSFLEKIADAVGMSPEEVRDELSGFFNAQDDEVNPEPVKEEQTSEDSEEAVEGVDTESEDDAEEEEDTALTPSDSVTLDRETYEDLRAAAQHGWQAKQESEERALVAEVDRWVSEGRISAALRSKAVAAMKRDAEIARDLYGSNPKGTIPRAEIGHGHDAKADAEENAVSVSDLDNLVAGRREGRNKR